MISRRTFLKRSAAALAILELGQGLEAKGVEKAPPGWRGKERVFEIPSFCEMCFWRCGIRGNVDKHGRLLKIDGNPDHPLTEGRLCARGNAGSQLLYDPDRLKYPLIRVGKRGEGKFRRASWNEALDYMASRLNAIKGELGCSGAAYFPHGIHARFFTRLLDSCGIANYAEPAFAQCRGAREVGYSLTFGSPVGSPEPVDLSRARVITLIGSHIGENVFTSQVHEFATGLSHGAKLIVVDPRFSTAASKADYWLPIRPGTDTALLLAWIHVLINENLFDKSYIEQYAYGFEALQQHVQPFTPDWAAPITDLSPDLIRTTARLMGKNLPAVALHPGRHVSWYGNDTQRARAMAIVTALLGAYGRPGGLFLPTPISVPGYPIPDYPEPEKERLDGAGTKYPLASDALGVTQELVAATAAQEPYPIKAWIVYGQNMLESIPDKPRTYEAIQKLDFFAVIDVMPTEQMLYADVVLPEATYLERYDDLLVVKSHKTPYVALRQPVVEPMYESKPGWWIAKEFAKRMGKEAYFPWKNIEEYLDYRLQAIGSSLQEIKATGVVKVGKGKPYFGADRKPEFATPSGKIELYSTELAELGFDPLPTFEHIDQPPPGFFRLLYGRSPVHSFARTQNNPWLLEKFPENQVWLNTDVARQAMLNDGEYVQLENQDGVVSRPIRLRMTQGIRPDAVYMVHGFGQQSPLMRRAYHVGASDNALMTRYRVDPIMGGSGLRVNMVRILKDGEPVTGATISLAMFRGKDNAAAMNRTKPVLRRKSRKQKKEEGC